MKKFIPFSVCLLGVSTFANGAVVSNSPGTIIDPAGASEVDFAVTGSESLASFNAQSNLYVLQDFGGMNSGDTHVLNNTGLPDVRFIMPASRLTNISDNVEFNTSSGQSYAWSGTNGQTIRIEFGTWNGSTFVADQAVKSAGLTLLNFGGAYNLERAGSEQIITYYDSSDTILSTQTFEGGGTDDDGSAFDFFSGYISGSANIAYLTMQIFRESGPSYIAIDDVAFTVPAPDPMPGNLQFTSTTFSGSYDSGGVTISVERTVGSDGAVSVDYATADGTATAGVDYTASSGTLTWADGVGGNQTAFIPLSSNPDSEGKSFSIGLSGPSGGAVMGSPDTATINISGSMAGTRPNIILFFMDDMGINDLGTYTYPETNPYPGSGPTPISYASEFNPLPPPNVANGLTPRIDSLATDGVKFSSFYAAVSVCTPSRAGLMTGCYATRVDMEEVIWNSSQQHGLNPTEITLAERLKQAGYTTGIIGKWHLGWFGGSYSMDFNPLRHGFDMFLGTNSGVVNSIELYDGESIAATVTTSTGGSITSPIDTITEKGYLLEAQTERSLSFIENAHSNGQPFFLYFSTIAPHTPCWPHPDFINSSSHSQYYDVVAELDYRVGQFLDKLTELGISDNTLVIFTSDNGPWVSRYESNPSLRQDPENTVGSAYPYRGYKRGANEGGPRVPFLARLPGRIPAGLVVDGLGSSIDLMPTLLNLVGGEVPDDRPIDGVDIWPLMDGSTSTSPRSSFFYYEEGDTSAVGVRQGDSKYLKKSDYGANTGVFNLATDIQESTNLGSSQTLTNLLTNHNDSMSRRTRATSKSNSIEVDDDTVTVTEGGTATFNVRLLAPANLTVSIGRFSGDEDLDVQSGASLSFTTGNYNTWQTVTLEASSDPDFVNSGATFRATASGLHLREIFALESDTTTPPLSSAEAWRQLWFGQTGNTGDAADGVDFESDGLVNLLERAFGSDPTLPSLDATMSIPPSLSIVSQDGSDYLTLTYRRIRGGTGSTGVDYSADDLTYTVESDSDMAAPWTEGAVTQVGLPVDNGDGTETVTVRLNSPISAEVKQFLRLKVQSNL